MWNQTNLCKIKDNVTHIDKIHAPIFRELCFSDVAGRPQARWLGTPNWEWLDQIHIMIHNPKCQGHAFSWVDKAPMLIADWSNLWLPSGSSNNYRDMWTLRMWGTHVRHFCLHKYNVSRIHHVESRFLDSYSQVQCTSKQTQNVMKSCEVGGDILRNSMCNNVKSNEPV